MKISNEELEQILMRADDEFDSIKDKCHDLYDENVMLKNRINELEQQKKYNFLLIPDENGTIYDADSKRYRLERINENRE